MREKRIKEIRKALRTEWDKSAPVAIVQELLRAVVRHEKTIAARDAVIERLTKEHKATLAGKTKAIEEITLELGKQVRLVEDFQNGIRKPLFHA